ncbi:hypothetical protein GNI_086840 [Gregarina niphandrodes]|uniref:KHDC4/BBP-like KH-domain type I domain-containing protein n=1 Tax=Gregarina niphandrodes TaxID=110365 RepID=A0A023B5Z3_GRENI|nr:hypothetical protein GNI_086840 [Gregarina niphandrodes]EZG63418.1 hypothetical protein GNI_086840 [Gregarina niphandrodes]|eukprot:XP_011130680.1 hypothetical protein GNI_086840 [Gregarina niphandrodes]
MQRKDRRGRADSSQGSAGRNPRSKEDKPWKHCTQIPISGIEFPPNIKPAALIIGSKGHNHARLQDESGCCVQLRGVGISSPGTPGSADPLHLFVKYDQPEQLRQLREVLASIIAEAFARAGTTPNSMDFGLGLQQKPYPGADYPPANNPYHPGPDYSNAGPGPNPYPDYNAPTHGYPGPGQGPGQGPGPGQATTRYPAAGAGYGAAPLKMALPPSNPLECFYSIHLLLHGADGPVSSSRLLETYEEFYGWPIDSRFTMLGCGNVNRSLSMLTAIIQLQSRSTGAVLGPGHMADPNDDYLLRPLLPPDTSLATLKEAMGSSVPKPSANGPPPNSNCPPPKIVAPRVVHPKPKRPATTPAPGPSLARNPPGPAGAGPGSGQPTDVLPQDLIVEGLVAIVREIQQYQLGEDPDRNEGFPLMQACDELSRRTGVILNYEAFGYKGIVE